MHCSRLQQDDWPAGLKKADRYVVSAGMELIFGKTYSRRNWE